MPCLPLDGLLVLDLTRHRAGPYTSRLLADFGARVIKIEGPIDLGDSMGGSRQGFDFQNLHRNKESLSLNLKSEEGKSIFLKLVRKADVVLENFRPEVKHRLGIDYETVREINPGIVYGSISGFGQVGPYRSRPAVDQIIQGMTGFMSVTGFPGQEPLRAGAAVADISAGMVLAQGLLIALYQREKTGRGQWVHTSLVESLVSMLDFQVALWLNTGEVPKQTGNDHPTLMPTSVFPTADGQVNIAAAEDQKFRTLCEALGIAELADDPMYASTAKRSAHRQNLRNILSARTVRHQSAELQEKLNALGIPCGPLYTIEQAMDDAQMKSLQMTHKVVHPRLGVIELLGQPLHLEGPAERPAVHLPAPEYGEHTEEILSQLLGFDKTFIGDLHARGVV